MKKNNLFKRIGSIALAGALTLTSVFTGKTVKVAAATRTTEVTNPKVTEAENTTELSLSKTAKALGNGQYEITLTASGTDKETDSAVVFVIDRSNSMDEEYCTIDAEYVKGFFGYYHNHSGACKYETYLNTTKKSAKAAVDTVAVNEYTKVAVVSYGSDVKTECEFTNNKTTAKNAIDKIRIDSNNGATNIQAGIKRAEDILAKTNAGIKSIVLLTDGAPTLAYKITNIDTTDLSYFNIKNTCKNKKHTINASLKDSSKYVISTIDYNKTEGALSESAYSYSVDTKLYANCQHGVECKQDGFTLTNTTVNATIYEADKAKASGITIYGIALGNEGESVLADCVSGNNIYTSNSSNLSSVYNTIAGKIAYAATNAVVTDPMGDMFNMVKGSLKVSQGETTFDEKTETITWNAGKISSNTPVKMTYIVEFDSAKEDTLKVNGEYPTNGKTVIDYTNNIGAKASQEFNVPTIKVANTYAVSYDLNGGSSDEEIKTVEYDPYTTVYVTSVVPSKAKCVFAGWELDGKIYNANAAVEVGTADVTLKAVWTEQFDVLYFLDGTLVDEATKTFDKGTDVTEFTADAYVKELLANKVTEDRFINEVSVENGDDVKVYATTLAKEYTVSYYVDGEFVGDETVKYGEDATGVSYELPEGKEFTTEFQIPTNVTSNLRVDAYTEVKQFTVYYFVNNSYVGDEVVVYDGNAQGIEYVVPEGYDFSGFELPTNVKENTNVYATLSKKQYTVTFLNEDGTVVSQETVEYLDSTKNEVKKPAKADDKKDGDAATQTPATWVKYSFDKWVAQGEYTVADTQSVTQDMTFVATYTGSNVGVKFYVLNTDLEQPSELSHYDKKNYSQGSVGTIYSWTEIANNDEAVAANLATVPTSFKLYNSNKELKLEDGQFIKWYVIKSESDNWHVDGIITNQKYNLTVNYVEKDSEGKDVTIAPSTTKEIIAAQNYTVDVPEIAGYEYSEATGALDAVAPYEDVEVTLVYVRKAFPLTINYLFADNTVAAEQYTDTVVFEGEYEVVSPVLEGYTASTEKVSGTMPACEVVYNVYYSADKFFLTVNYVYEDGTPVVNENGEAVVVTEEVAYGSEYSVTTNAIEGYTFDKEVVSGTMPAANVEETVTYTKNSYKVTYFVDGELYDEFTVYYGDSVDVDSEEYIASEGYTFSGWTVTAGDVDFVAGDVEISGTTEKVIVEENEPEDPSDDEEEEEETPADPVDPTEPEDTDDQDPEIEDPSDEREGEVEADDDTETDVDDTEDTDDTDDTDDKEDVEDDDVIDNNDDVTEEDKPSRGGEVEADNDTETGDSNTVAVVIPALVASVVTIYLFTRRKEDEEEA